jgi:hypothetical protein
VDIQTAIHKVKAARAAIAAHRHKKPVELQANRTALALAESELREIGRRLGVSICLLEPEPEATEQVCAYLKSWGK